MTDTPHPTSPTAPSGLTRFALLSALSALSAAAPLLVAPTFAQETLPGFSEVVDVRVVNLEVVVVDGQGNRVQGLVGEDFELTVDGEATAIDFFTEVRERQPMVGAGGRRDIGGLEAGEPVPTNYLVFIDDLFSVNQDRDRVLGRLADQLGALGENDRVAVVAFDGQELALLTEWTRDRDRAARALREAIRRPTFGLQRIAEQRQNDTLRTDAADLRLLTIERIRAAGGSPPAEPFARVGLEPQERSYAFRLTGQLERSVVAATSAMRSFVGARGRKVMLLLTGGWPFDPAEFTVGAFSPLVEEARQGRLQSFFSYDLYAPLVDTANLTGFTLYPVDVPGPDSRIGLDASESGGDFERLGPGASLRRGPTREQQTHATLDYLAERTGGVALRNARRDEALALVAEDTGSYYWLGFSPDREADDERHDIEVRIKGRDDLEVRTRDSFVDLSPKAEMGMVVESALLLGDPPSARPLVLRFGRPDPGFRKMRVPLEVGIDMREITLVPNQGRYQNVLDIRIAVLTEAGGRSDISYDTISIDGAEPPRPGQLYWYETVLTMRKREHRIVVAVRDPVSGALLSSSAEIAP